MSDFLGNIGGFRIVTIGEGFKKSATAQKKASRKWLLKHEKPNKPESAPIVGGIKP